MNFVTDTHALLWWFIDSPKISPKATEIFEKCEQGENIIFIPSIVIAEALSVFKKKRIPFDFKKLFITLSPYPPIFILMARANFFRDDSMIAKSRIKIRPHSQRSDPIHNTSYTVGRPARPSFSISGSYACIRMRQLFQG